MKLKEIVSDYLVKEDDNLRHIEKTVSTIESVTDKPNVKTEVISNAQPSKTAPIDSEWEEQ